MSIDDLIEIEVAARDELARLLRESKETDLTPPGQLDGTEGRLSRQDSLLRHQMDKEAQRRRELRIRFLKEALERMDTGSYGFCAECGIEIALQRLQASPEAVLCSECASRH